MAEIASLVLFANDLARTAAFYRAAGVALEDEEHDGGPKHCAAELGDVHFAVYQAEVPLGANALPLRSAASDFPGLYVDSLDDVAAALTDVGSPVLEGHGVRPWGCRMIFADPDGRGIEINQRGHCPGE